MGLCFSKKKEDSTSNEDEVVGTNKEEKKNEAQSEQKVAAFVAEEKPKKSNVELINVFNVVPKAEGVRIANTPIRTSSCTKEEVDAILIQCGRLSRSSSEKREYSGSKRSFDFDNERSKEEEEDCEKPISGPSPRRRTPNRERSGSRESGNRRRVSRSPVKRLDAPAKIVPVPVREKGVGNANASRNSSGVGNIRRNVSPRSRSPANGNSRGLNENAQNPSLSRSSSRKVEQSPYRRNPMTEIDDNSMKGDYCGNVNKVQKSKEGDEAVKKGSQIQTQVMESLREMLYLLSYKDEVADQLFDQKMNDQHKSSSNNTTTISNCFRDQLMSCRAKEKQKPEPEILEEVKDSKGASKTTEAESLNQRPVTRMRSSRRSSKDLDNILGPNPTTYTSQLLEDIQNYHQQNACFSLPACVSKACSILEAVADLNSSSSDQSRRGLNPNGPLVESEIVVKDDLMEPSLHKYISVRDLGGETEPQESAGSNSFVGELWPSLWEHNNSINSTDRYWTSQSNHGEEVKESSVAETRCSSSKSFASTTISSSKKRDVDDRTQHYRGGCLLSGGNGKAGARAHSLPVVAATCSS